MLIICIQYEVFKTLETKEKIDTFLERKEIRDIFGIEFLYKKGIELKESPEKLIKILDGIKLFKKNDYKVKLGSLLEKEQRKYYINENFKILIAAINEKLKLTG